MLQKWEASEGARRDGGLEDDGDEGDEVNVGR